MTINKMELRFNEFELNKNEQGQLKVSGYVNKTNQWSQTLGKQKKFVERILPGAFCKAIQNGNEIHFLAEHENAKILSSTRNGSLSLREDEQGLYMEATISDTSWGRDYHTLITDGIIKNMSFGMQVLKDSWKKLADGTYERSISDIYLAEVSAVRNPAYVQSTIQAARSIEVVEDVDIPEDVEIENENREESNQMVVKEKRELTLEEQLQAKRISLRNYERLAKVVGSDKKLENDINKVKGEIRNMEAKIKATNTAQNNEGTENRDIINTQTEPGKFMTESQLSKSIIDGSKFPLLAGLFNIFEGRTGSESQVGAKFKKIFAFDDSEAVIYDENTPISSAVDPKFTEIEFQQKRVLTLFETSQKTLMDNVIELEKHANEWIAIRNLRTIQSQAFGKGDKDGDTQAGKPANLHFQSILDYNTQDASKLINGQKITEVTGVTLENINVIYDEYVEGNTGEAVWVVDAPSIVSSLKDEANLPLLKRENRANGSIGTIYGFHVFVQKMEDEKQVKKGKLVLMNPKAYGVAINGDSKTQKITDDSIQVLRDGALFLGQTFMQGKVVNPYAIKIIK